MLSVVSFALILFTIAILLMSGGGEERETRGVRRVNYTPIPTR